MDHGQPGMKSALAAARGAAGLRPPLAGPSVGSTAPVPAQLALRLASHRAASTSHSEEHEQERGTLPPGQPQPSGAGGASSSAPTHQHQHQPPQPLPQPTAAAISTTHWLDRYFPSARPWLEERNRRWWVQGLVEARTREYHQLEGREELLRYVSG